jgi:tetratricopeptide (TPR) repeat protein
MRAAVIALLVVLGFAADADADKRCNCLAVAGDVAAAVQAEVAKADGLYARGDYAAALALYAKAHAASPKDSALLYAQAMAKWQLGVSAEAKALLEKYLAAGGQLAYRERAEASISDINAKVTAPVGAAVGAGGTAIGMVGGVAHGAVDTGIGLTDKRPKPKKVARGAGIVLGVIAVAAITAVGVHAIAAGVKDDVELDAKFDLGLGVTGVAVGISAIYVGGLTTATGAAAGAGNLRCETLPAKRPIVAPMVTHGGGGLAAAMTF